MAPLPVFSETSRSQLLVVVSVSHSNPISTSPGRFWRAAACSRGWFNTIHVPRARRSVFMGYYWDVNVSVRWDLWPDWGVRTWRPTAACADGDLYGSSLSWPCRVHADAATHGMGTPPGDSAVSTGQAASGLRRADPVGAWGGGLRQAATPRHTFLHPNHSVRTFYLYFNTYLCTWINDSLLEIFFLKFITYR